ncbi:hypothetical protein GCM10027569_41530 [Flindersiella endophytica]
MERGVSEIGLRLDAGSAQHPQAARLLGGVLEQGRLTDTRLAVQDQAAAGAASSTFEQLVDRRAFSCPTQHFHLHHAAQPRERTGDFTDSSR